MPLQQFVRAVLLPAPPARRAPEVRGPTVIWNNPGREAASVGMPNAGEQDPFLPEVSEESLNPRPGVGGRQPLPREDLDQLSVVVLDKLLVCTFLEGQAL